MAHESRLSALPDHEMSLSAFVSPVKWHPALIVRRQGTFALFPNEGNVEFSDLTQCLGQVCDEVLGVFNSY